MANEELLRRAWRQRTIDWVCWFFFCWPLMLIFRWGLGIRIENLRELRREYRRLTDDRRPLIICANHLTYIDSVILIYAFGDHFWYWFHFRRLTWNLPAADYRGQPFFRFVAFFSKCLFIDRAGTPTHKRAVLDTGRALLERGEVLTIFPEGRRSKTGRFDDGKLAYGVGKIVATLPECRVLCVYLRSADQRASSKLPPRGSCFRLRSELREYRPAEIANPVETVTQDIARRIRSMEELHFAKYPEVRT